MKLPDVEPHTLDRLRKELADRHVVLQERLPGRGASAHVFAAETSLNEQVVVRFALKSRWRSPIAGQREKLDALLFEARGSFVLPKPMTPLEDPDWHVSLWERCSHDLATEIESQRDRCIIPSRLLPMIANIAKGLDLFYRRNYIHGDVSPRNILMRGDVALLADFDTLVERIDGTDVTFHGCGSPGYAAPDFTSPACSTADLYSLAAVYVRARTGRDPDLEWFRSAKGLLEGMGPNESRTVLAALAERHDDRAAFDDPARHGSGCLHGNWVSALDRAIQQDGHGLLQTHEGLGGGMLQISVGLHGVNCAAKTSMLVMMGHDNAGKTPFETGAGRGLRVAPAPDEDGVTTTTLAYLRNGRERLVEYGDFGTNKEHRLPPLRFEVAVGGRRAIVTTEDYAGETVILRPSAAPEHEHLQLAERFRATAGCDVQVLLLPPDVARHDITDSIRILRDYMLALARELPDRPQPVVLAVYTKGDLIPCLDLDDGAAVEKWLRTRMLPVQPGQRSESGGLGIDLVRLAESIPGAQVVPMVVSAFGTPVTARANGTANNGISRQVFEGLQPKYLWLLMARAVELALARFEQWAYGKLHEVDRLIAGRDFARAKAAFERASTALEPYFARFPDSRQWVAVRASRLDAHFAATRRRYRGRLFLVAAALVLSLATAGQIWASHRDRVRREEFVAQASPIPQIRDVAARLARARSLLDSPLVKFAAPEELEILRTTAEADLATLEDAEFERAKAWREEHSGGKHAAARRSHTKQIEFPRGRHSSTYETWDRTDAEEEYWFQENNAVAVLLGMGNDRPTSVLAAVDSYAKRFPRSSKAKEVSALELAANEGKAREYAASVYEAAIQAESAGFSRAEILVAWRKALECNASDPRASECEARVQRHAAALDEEEYAKVYRRASVLRARGSDATRSDLSEFAEAELQYLTGPGGPKLMVEAVQASREAVLQMLGQSGRVTVVLEAAKIPWDCGVWLYSNSAKDNSVFTVRSGTEQKEYHSGMKGERSGPWKTLDSNGASLTVRATWGEDLEISVAQGNGYGRQRVTVETATDATSELTMDAPHDWWHGSYRVEVRVRIQSRDLDLKRAVLPAYPQR